MTLVARLSALSRVPAAAMVAWDRYLSSAGEAAADNESASDRVAPSPEGPVEELADALLARWPDAAPEGRAALRRQGLCWAKLHEPRPAPPPWAA